MSANLKSQLDPSLLSDGERKVLDKLGEAVEEDERPHLVGREGVRIDLPDPIFHLLVHTIRMMRRGQKVLLIPEEETFTTQAAANVLGVSRPFLIALLDKNEVAFHMVGKHRRIAIKDLMEYADKRDRSRKKTLDDLSDRIAAAGLYDITE